MLYSPYSGLEQLPKIGFSTGQWAGMAAGASHCLHGWTCSLSLTAAIRAARRGGTRGCATKGAPAAGDKSHAAVPAQTPVSQSLPQATPQHCGCRAGTGHSLCSPSCSGDSALQRDPASGWVN